MVCVWGGGEVKVSFIIEAESFLLNYISVHTLIREPGLSCKRGLILYVDYTNLF